MEQGGRHGFFSDLHGDRRALDDAFRHLHDVDEVTFLGDAVGGAQDEECVGILRQRNVPCLCGNHDLDPAEAGLLSPDAQAFVASWPVRRERGSFLAIHSRYEQRPGGLRFEYVYDSEDADALLSLHPQRLIFLGHTHVPILHARNGEGVVRQVLSESRSFRLDPHTRYVVNVPDTRTGVVIFDALQDLLEFRLYQRPVDRFLGFRNVQDCVPVLGVDLLSGQGLRPSRPWWRFWS